MGDLSHQHSRFGLGEDPPTVTDPVYAADVLYRLIGVGEPPDHHASGARRQLMENQREKVDTLLAHGGGDPVVIMPDGTLRRLTQVADNWYLPIDPVEPT